MRAVPRLCEFYPGICLTPEEKARKNLSQGKKNLSQVTKNLSQSTVYILPKHPEAEMRDTRTHRRTAQCALSLSRRKVGQRAKWAVIEASALLRCYARYVICSWMFRDRQAVPRRPWTTNIPCVTSQKSEDQDQIAASTDVAFVLLIPHHTPRSSQSATHRELHPRALLLVSSSYLYSLI